MLATAAGRIEKEITPRVTVGVKGWYPGRSERIGGGGGGLRCRQTRGTGRTSQAGNHVTNGNSRAHMIKSQEWLLSEHLLCVSAVLNALHTLSHLLDIFIPLVCIKELEFRWSQN